MSDILLNNENGILTVVMDAPKNNLMTTQFHEEFETVMDNVQVIAERESVKGMIIRGGGRNFCVGADVDALKERTANELYDDSTGKLPESHIAQKRHFTFLRDLPFPVVSVVTGFCIGSGSEIALNCHYRIVEKSARIGQPESTFGILPGLGGIARTIELCGMKNAYELVMTGRLFPSEEACELGWGDILTDKKQGLVKAYSLIDFISEKFGDFSPANYRRYIELYKNRGD
ncbi:MAG: enoyl-CoA hydratase/isomerase family protein [Ruminococcus albus]|jgi:enoyl-CoA hydratase|nr:enoyl-CoA hydratase/isomerase family protein [Ruminococcus albus]